MAYPCGKCGEECSGVKEVACDCCQQWFHQNCEQISNTDFQYLKKCPLSYTCSICCAHPDGSFNFDLALQRLGNVSLDKIKTAVRVESIFMRFLPKRLRASQVFNFQNSMLLDTVASKLLGPSTDYVPVQTSGNGNCLFNAISLAIKGDQSLATELRVRASMELVQNREYYEKFHLGNRLHLVSDKYDVAVRDCITNYAFSSAWTVHACASVISRSIKSVYPPVNGILDPSVSVLNAVFPPRALKSRHTVTLMWSSCSLSKPSGNWYPDHFVPLLPNDTNSTVIDLSSDVDFPPLSKSRPSQSPPAKSPTSFQASPVSSPAKSPPAP